MLHRLRHAWKLCVATLATLLMAGGLAGTASVLSSAPANALGPNAVLPGFNATTFGPNDDGTYPCTGPGPGDPNPGCANPPATVPLPFSINFFGTAYNSLYVNNNGNVSFDAPLPDFTPFNLFTTSHVMIAPFFADVDTRAGNLAAFGTGTANGRPAFGVTWPGVGCFDSNASVLDNFQAIIIDRSDVGAGNFDIEFNYDQIQWDSGQASGGDANCLHGQSARAGFTNGTSTPGDSLELNGSGVDGAFLDSNTPTGLINNSLNSNHLGRYIFSIRNGQPTTLTNVTTTLSAGSAHGGSVTVAPNTPVTDSATLTGTNSATAGGTVTYNVYSDNNCQNLVATGGTKAVTHGTVADSNAVSLAATGTYYWQAAYSGDTLNNGSTSRCGDEVETVGSNPTVVRINRYGGPMCADNKRSVRVDLSVKPRAGTTIGAVTDPVMHVTNINTAPNAWLIHLKSNGTSSIPAHNVTVVVHTTNGDVTQIVGIPAYTCR